MLGQCRRSAPDSGTGPTVAEPVKKLKDIKACNVIFFAHPRSMISRGAGRNSVVESIQGDDNLLTARQLDQNTLIGR